MDGLWWTDLLAQAPGGGIGNALQWQFIAMLVLVFVVPFVVGTYLARALRLKEFGTQMGVVLCAIALSLAPFFWQVMHGRSWKDALRWGIDLAGGTNLIYAVDVAAAKADEKEINKATMDKLVGAVGRRINPGGAEEVTVRRVGADRIEVIIPGADRELVARKKREIVNLGSLEFAILANEKDHRREIAAGRQLPPTEDRLFEGGRLAASWRTVAKGQDVTQNRDDRTAIREVERILPDGTTAKVTQFLVVHDPPERAVTGKYLKQAQPSMDQNGQLAVSFTFNAKGGQLFSSLTGRYQPDATEGFHRRLAVLLNGEIQTAPNLITRISTHGQITGQFKREEIDELVNVLNAGALEVPLIQDPVSEFTISPTLGIDVQTDGIRAVIISAIAVIVLMLVYYRVGGVIANLCLVLNLLLVVGAMALIEATFTLPGLAGLVLTIGMAVDSNVLINERMREELARGASLRMAIENGFDKALSAIIDGNVTALLTAAILYWIGSDLIRGFAVSLFLGLVMSLFSVLVFGHLCFKVLERKRWIRSLTMYQIIGKTNIDFLGQRYWAFLFSGALIVGGLVALAMRGERNLDIDFSGGTLVTFEFVESQNTDDVQARLIEQFDSTVNIERLVRSDETTAAGSGHRFRLRTTQQDQKAVAAGISEAFAKAGMELVRATMEIGDVGTSPAATPGAHNPYATGPQAILKFHPGLGTTSAANALGDALEKVTSGDGASKYPAAEGLVTVEGRVAAKKSADSASSTEQFVEVEARAMPAVSPEDFAAALKTMQTTMAANPAFEEVNSFDSAVASDTQRGAVLAILASLVAIVGYIWFRFENIYFGVAGLIALGHDVLVTAGAVALGAYLSGTPIGPILMLDDFKINLTIVASLLSIVGYSLNDTVVIFDRIREIKGKNPRVSYDMINLSVNETLGRTIMTGLTTLIVVAILYIVGGDGIHGFAFANIIGSIASCYSTVYIANPALLYLVSRQEKPAAGSSRAAAAAL
jgi:SecD/SecF fusion protein